MNLGIQDFKSKVERVREMKSYTHNEALQKFLNYSDLEDSGDGYFRELRDFAERLPAEPFTAEHFERLLEADGTAEAFKFHAYVFAMGGHSEVLPHVRKFFSESERLKTKLDYAAVMAQLGDEAGYQFIEDVFQRFMRKEEELKNFDMEDLIFIFDRILTNERGQEMLARYRKEADYYVVWENLEYE